MRDIDVKDRDLDRELDKEGRDESKNEDKVSKLLDRLDSEKRDPDNRERTILETRNISLRDEERINNKEISKIAMDIKEIAKNDRNPANLRDIIEKMQVLDARNEELKAEQVRINSKLSLEKDGLNIPKELERLDNRNDFFLKRAEKSVVYKEESGRVSLYASSRDDMRENNKRAATAVEDLCRYKSITGAKIEPETRSFISSLDLKNLDVKIEKEHLERIVEGKHPETIRDVYEFGLRVGDEKFRPEQMNNICNILKETDSKELRVVELDRLLSGRVPSSRMNEDEREKFIKNCERDLEQKKEFKETYDRALQKDDLKSEDFRSNTRGMILIKEPTLEKMRDDKEFAKNTTLNMFLTAKENDLKVANKTQDMLREIPKERLDKEEIRDIVIKAPEIMPDLLQSGLRLPEHITVDVEKYQKAMDEAGKMDDKEVKLAVYSVVFRENDKPYLLGERSEEILKTKDFNATKPIHEIALSIVDKLDKNRETDKERNERIERMSIRESLNKLDRDNPKDAIKIISHTLSECARTDVYARDVIKEIKDKKIDFSSLKDSEKTAPEKYIIEIAKSNQPEILVDLNRMGIQIHRGGLINDEKLSGAVFAMKEYSERNVGVSGPDKAATTDLSALLQSSFVDRNGSLKNPLNMGSKEDNRAAREEAVRIATSGELRDYINKGKEIDRIDKDRERDHLQAFKNVVDVLNGREVSLSPVKEANRYESPMSKNESRENLTTTSTDVRNNILETAARLFVEGKISANEVRSIEQIPAARFDEKEVRQADAELRSAAKDKFYHEKDSSREAVHKSVTDAMYYKELIADGRLESSLDKADKEGLVLFDMSLKTQSALINILRDETISKDEKTYIVSGYIKGESPYMGYLRDENRLDKDFYRSETETAMRNSIRVIRNELTLIPREEIEKAREEEKSDKFLTDRERHAKAVGVLLERQEAVEKLMDTLKEVDKTENGKVSDITNDLLGSLSRLYDSLNKNIAINNGEILSSRDVIQDVRNTDALYHSIERYMKTDDGREVDIREAATEMLAHENLIAGSKERNASEERIVVENSASGLIEYHSRAIATDCRYQVHVSASSIKDYEKVVSVLADELRNLNLRYSVDLLENGKSFESSLRDTKGMLLIIDMNNPYELSALSDEAKGILRSIPDGGLNVKEYQPKESDSYKTEGRLGYQDITLSEFRENHPNKEGSEVLREIMNEYDRMPLEKDKTPFHLLAEQNGREFRDNVTTLTGYVRETPMRGQKIAESYVACTSAIARITDRIETAYRNGEINDREKEALDYMKFENEAYIDYNYGYVDNMFKEYMPPEVPEIPEDLIIPSFTEEEIIESMEEYIQNDLLMPDEIWEERSAEDAMALYNSNPITYVSETAMDNREKEVFVYQDSVMYDALLKDDMRLSYMPDLREFYESVRDRTEEINEYVRDTYGMHDLDYTYDFSTESVIVYQIEDDGQKFAIASYDGDRMQNLCEESGFYGESYFSIRSVSRSSGMQPPEERLFDEVRAARAASVNQLDYKIERETERMYSNNLFGMNEDFILEILSRDTNDLDAALRSDVEEMKEVLGDIKFMEMERDSLLNPELDREERERLATEEPAAYVSQDDIERWIYFSSES